jgi:hypothetical protein
MALFVAGAAPAYAGGGGAPTPSCQLGAPGHPLKAIVYLQFDNVHLRRDNPNVPSDLEQIPSLLHFLQDQGTLLTNHHTPLISHTAVDIVTSLTGVYGEKFGWGVGNSFGFFDPTGKPHFQSSFAYWTDVVKEGGPTPVPQMVDQRGKIHPAPWVPFTRAGCDVGGFSTANIEFENIGSDINNVFGPTSPQAAEAASNPTKATADFEGIIIHCAMNSRVCKNGAAPDLLPDEPGGYSGFSALYGNVNVAPAINHGNGFVLDLGGQHVSDGNGNDGFPGFDPTPSQTLGYAAQMLEAGVAVVYLYIEDAHDNHLFQFPSAPSTVMSPDGTFGPGEAGYVFQLQQYESAFSKFFNRLRMDGFTKDNTLFVITSDENDHFAGNVARATPAGCDGVTTPCTYPTGAKGEVDADLSKVYDTEFGNTTPFSVHSDDAPTFYITGNPTGQTDTATRTLERQAGLMQGFDPAVGNAGATNNVAQALADHAEEHLLHMLSSDHNRDPNFTLFGNPDYFLTASGHPSTSCTPQNNAASCFVRGRDFAWNHGDFQNQITHTWVGIVGPGVRHLGPTGDLFTDHTDIRPTIINLAHLTDDYAHDGRVLFEVLNDGAVPDSLRAHRDTLSSLAAAYKAINAPNGPLGHKTLVGISTRALKGDDATYAALDEKIQDITTRRNDIAGQMIAMLEAAAFNGQAIDEQKAEQLIDQANDLLASLD